VLLGGAVYPIPAQHTVREVFDLGHNAFSWTLAAIRENHLLGFHRKPPFALHLLTRQDEEKRVSESKEIAAWPDLVRETGQGLLQGLLLHSQRSMENSPAFNVHWDKRRQKPKR
jgi:hypothetical protein